MARILIPKPLVERSQIVEDLPDSKPFYEHITLSKGLETDDIIIFPDNSVIYEYDESLPRDCYPERKHKVAFVVCRLLKSSGEEMDYYFYPLEMITTFYKFNRKSREIDYNTTFSHSIDGMKASDWFSKQIDKRDSSLRNRYLSPFEGHAYYVRASEPMFTWRPTSLPHGSLGISVIFSLSTLDKETTNRIIINHKLKNELFNLKKKVTDIKKKYEFGFLKFIKDFGLEEPFSCSDYSTIITYVERIEFEDAKYKAEKIMLENPWGLKTYYKDRNIDTHSLSGYRDIIGHSFYIIEEQNRYNELRRIKKLEPKYTQSPYLGKINLAMDRMKENHFAECDVVEILFNISNKYDILVIFGKFSSNDIVHFEFDDKCSREMLHYSLGFYMQYDKGIIRENLIRKIIDSIEKYKKANDL